jgi:hypothetical protein
LTSQYHSNILPEDNLTQVDMPNLMDSDVEKQPAGSDVVGTPPEDKANPQHLYGWKLYLVLIGLGLALFLGALDMAVLSTVNLHHLSVTIKD